MRALVVANCTTQTYVEGLQKLFPDWEVRGAAADVADAWLADGSKPAFEAYLRDCDLYVGEPPDGSHFGGVLNPSVDRVIIPALHFRGLHPDIATLPNFRGPLSFAAVNSQCSLIMITARALGMTVANTAAMFCSEIYRELGFFDLYKTAKNRLLKEFGSFGIHLSEEFAEWEKQGSFFYVCHHPKPFVLIDILRRALLGRYLDAASFRDSASIALTQADYFAAADVWPVYPELAAALGFQGSLTWIRPARPQAVTLSLGEVIEDTFAALEAMPENWRTQAFIQHSALILRDYLDRPPGASQLADRPEDEVDPFTHLVGAERQAIEAARETPYDPATLHRAFEILRQNGRLDEIDLLYERAPRAVQNNHAVISVWCSIPRIRGDGPEQLRRAEQMGRIHPNQAKSLNHMIFALHATKGFEETMRHVEKWMVEYPDDINILGPAANIALWSEQYGIAEQIFRKLDAVQHGGLEGGSYRMLIIALRRQNKTEEATRTLAEALRKFPGSNMLVDL
jgi:tetratricopeptide (TPR) repeat protein